jgi:hypothetical protein
MVANKFLSHCCRIQMPIKLIFFFSFFCASSVTYATGSFPEKSSSANSDWVRVCTASGCAEKSLEDPIIQAQLNSYFLEARNLSFKTCQFDLT